jgi:hypothetical protein
LERLVVGDHRGGKTALVAHGGLPASALDHGIEVVKNLGGPADRFGNGGGTMPEAFMWLSKYTVASTVGLPRESNSS